MAHEDFAHLTGDGSVAREIWGQEHSIKAETFRSNSRHRRTDSKLSCFIGSGADNGATTPPSDDDRLAAQLRIVALFDRRIKGVHVDMNDLANGQGVQCPGVSKALISFRNSDEFMKTAKCPPLIVANLLCGASMPSTKALPMPAGVTKSSVPWRIPVCARNLITREEQMRRAPHAGWPFFVHQSPRLLIILQKNCKHRTKSGRYRHCQRAIWVDDFL